MATPEPDRRRQREVVDAFYAAARSGDFGSLLGALHPDVVLRADFGPAGSAGSGLVRRAEAVARRARAGAVPGSEVHPAQVNGAAGAVITRHGRPFAVMAFSVAGDRITEIDIIGDPDRVRRVAAAILPH